MDKPISLETELARLIKRRDQLAVITDILTVAFQPVNRTKILYRANLSYAQMRRYLTLLLEMGLLQERVGSRRVYETTEEGARVLRLLTRRQDRRS